MKEMIIMVKLISLDLDGTLLNEKSQVSKRNLEAIKFAQRNGIVVVINTGRAYFDVKEIFKDSNINTWIIGANGATIHNPNDELLHSLPINKKDALNILSWLEQEELYYEVFSNHSIFTPQNGREQIAIEMDRLISANPKVSIEQLNSAVEEQFGQAGFYFIDSYKDLIGKDMDFYSILAFSFYEEKLRNGWKKFEHLNELTIVKSANHNFQMSHVNASKGNTLKMLAKELNIKMEDTAAIGDNFNDLSMFKIAGRGVAMGNARQQIKDACHEVTLSNVEDGVAHFIYSLFENGNIKKSEVSHSF
jgi:Cof subfamily protein (haloacid dehalogenase superfamily)